MGDISRRTLFRGAGVVAATLPAAALLPTDLAYAGATVTRATFSPFINQAFDVRAGVLRSTMKLLAIGDLDTHNSNHPRRFQLTFKATTAKRVQQGTYRFTHPKLGTMSIFIVPSPRTPGQYLAVFNAR